MESGIWYSGEKKRIILGKQREREGKRPRFKGGVFYFVRSLTMTYFRMEDPHYHWREVVSLSCSRWEGVGPTGYGRQTKLLSDADACIGTSDR